MAGSDHIKYLFLSLLQARVGSSLVARLGDLAPSVVLDTPPAELAERTGMSQKAVKAFDELQRSFDPDGALERLGVKGIRVLTLADEAYPRYLRDVPDPPPALFVDGELPRAEAVALVGSRKATSTGIEMARVLGPARRLPEVAGSLRRRLSIHG